MGDLPFTYPALLTAFSKNRRHAAKLTADNRCAMVMGWTLGLTPGPKDVDWTEVDGASNPQRDARLLAKSFVKAEQVAFAIQKKYGAPTVEAGGQKAIGLIAGKKGVVYLRDCWRTPREKLLRWLDPSGDHIDLWDGSIIEIYRHEAGANGLVRSAGKVLFWQAK